MSEAAWCYVAIGDRVCVVRRGALGAEPVAFHGDGHAASTVAAALNAHLDLTPAETAEMAREAGV